MSYYTEDSQLFRIDVDGEGDATAEEAERLRDFLVRPLMSIEARRRFRELVKAHEGQQDHD